ncbi:NAD-dependent succinate-semialdehyde dehydrogenase [Sphingomonas sp. MG17]|uniref:NAD-dependent succinate-semialdehyde dehydrogenase n=2 Tax=Sphingomonas tagetis TaxID=2949092 RepID=A0A9X2HHQ9_9SPHN|nr:NAD-dependent succinate-semialdehyde dehydrogenase [Sphingomonas tagetis]
MHPEAGPRADRRHAHPALRQQAYLDGAWIDADNRETIAVTDPATGDFIGDVPALGRPETLRAIAAAARAQRIWAGRTAAERAHPIARWAELMLEAREELASLMTLEQGKPLAEARGEIDYAASFLTWFAAEGQRLYGDVIPSHISGRRLLTSLIPVGVTAAVTPWNFPSAMITRKAGAALMAGCAMIVKPATETPFSALALAELAERAGIPAGLFSILTGDPEPICAALAESPVVRKLSFTGSTRVGRLLMTESAATLKKLSMELGGHAPFIVFDDTALAPAVQAAIDAKFQTSGQDCLAANRILVHQPLYPPFCDAFATATRALHVGNGFDDGVAIGPLIGPAAVAKCRDHVDDALEKGARLLCGGAPHPAGPNFFEPTVLADVTPAMRIFREETFGPVAAITPFADEAECIGLANDSEYGLAAYCFGGNLNQLWRVAEALDYGMVAVNSVKMTGPPIPFGGVKQSGLGREGSRHGITEYCELKYLCINEAPCA